MTFQVFASVVALLLALTSAAPAPQAASAALPPCSGKKVPCACPSGSTFANSTTYAVVGASATDVTAITSDFYGNSWTGLPTTGKNGPDNTVGSVRQITVGSDSGPYNVYEKLTLQDVKPDGSFTQEYEQAKVPTQVPGHPDEEFDGWWNTFIVRPLLPTESFIAWNEYRCTKGSPFQISQFHESAIKNVTSILQAQGNIKGVNIGPISDGP